MILNRGGVGIFVDGDNVFSSLRELGWRLDYDKLLKWILDYTGCSHPMPFYYGRKEVRLTDEKKGFLGVLERLRFHIKEIDAEIKTDGNGYICNADPYLITDMVRLSAFNRFNTAVIVSGDGDFSYPLETVRHDGINILVISTFNNVNKKKILNDRNIPFIDLKQIRNQVERQEK